MNEYYVETSDQFLTLDKKENDRIKYTCKSCGVESQFNYKKSRAERQSKLLCMKCSMKATNLEKYGVENSSQNADVRKKISEACKQVECESDIYVYTSEEFDNVTKRTGVTVHSKCTKCGSDFSFKYFGYKKYQRNLVCTSCLRHSDTDTAVFVASTEEFDSLEKKEGTKIKFVCNICQNESTVSYKPVRNETQRTLVCSNCQRRSTTKDRFGVEVFFNSRVYREKSKETSLKKYGTEFPSQSKVVKEKVKETNIKRLGVPYSMQSAEIMEKSRKSYIEKYGKDHPNFNHTYLYDGLYFDSKWELIFYIYHKDLGHNIEREPISFNYEFEGKTYSYNPDFRVDGQLYEIKGEQFFDSNGHMINPYDHSQDAKFEAKRQCALANGVVFYREKDIELLRLEVNSKYTSDYTSLFQIGLPFPYVNDPMVDKSDTGIIRHFHKSLYDASYKDCPSPKEAWEDKNLVKKVALNRLKYVGTCKPADIVRGFSVTRLAPKVSVFKHTLASELINAYIPESETIFDPFSGFSGRLIGAYNCGKCYTGQDIHPDHVKESNEIIQYKGMTTNKYSVVVQDILTDTPKCADALFTCPPYGGKEHWNKNNDAIEKTCDEWIDICLSKYACKKYLFVVDTTTKYKDNIVQVLTNKSHFGSNNEYVILIEPKKS